MGLRGKVHRSLANKRLPRNEAPDASVARAISGKRPVQSCPLREKPHARRVAAHEHSETVVLDLVQPLAAGRQCCGLYRKARRNKAGREGTDGHAD
jgi:hypothetical protein